MIKKYFLSAVVVMMSCVAAASPHAQAMEPDEDNNYYAKKILSSEELNIIIENKKKEEQYHNYLIKCLFDDGYFSWVSQQDQQTKFNAQFITEEPNESILNKLKAYRKTEYYKKHQRENNIIEKITNNKYK